MTVLMLIAFLAVAAVCFVIIARVGKNIHSGSETAAVCIAVCDLYSASWLMLLEIPNIRLSYGSPGEVLSAVKESRTVLGVLAEAPEDNRLCAVKIGISPVEIPLGDVTACPLSEAVRAYYLVYSADIHDKEISELIKNLAKS